MNRWNFIREKREEFETEARRVLMMKILASVWIQKLETHDIVRYIHAQFMQRKKEVLIELRKDWLSKAFARRFERYVKRKGKQRSERLANDIRYSLSLLSGVLKENKEAKGH